MSTTQLHTEENGTIGLITFSRAEKLNAFTPAMYTAFANALRNYDGSEGISVIVVRGAGGNFSSGNDVSEFLSEAPIDGEALANPVESPPADAVEALIGLDTPLIGAIEGSAAGFGATMLLHFDRVVMARGSYLLYPFVNLGVVPEAGSSMLLAELVGELHARRLLMDPSPISAEEAVQLRLATDLCDRGRALATSMEVAERMASRSRLAMATTKRLLGRHRAALRAQAHREFEAFAECLSSDDTRARVSALLRKEGS